VHCDLIASTLTFKLLYEAMPRDGDEGDERRDPKHYNTTVTVPVRDLHRCYPVFVTQSNECITVDFDTEFDLNAQSINVMRAKANAAASTAAPAAVAATAATAGTAGTATSS